LSVVPARAGVTCWHTGPEGSGGGIAIADERAPGTAMCPYTESADPGPCGSRSPTPGGGEGATRYPVADGEGAADCLLLEALADRWSCSPGACDGAEGRLGGVQSRRSSLHPTSTATSTVRASHGRGPRGPCHRAGREPWLKMSRPTAAARYDLVRALHSSGRTFGLSGMYSLAWEREVPALLTGRTSYGHRRGRLGVPRRQDRHRYRRDLH
jgi:hypothetical protein